MDHEKRLIKLYQQKIFLGGSSGTTPIKLRCFCQQGQPDHEDCWRESGRRLRPNGKYQCITRPYVGKYYKVTHLLILGKNHRDNTIVEYERPDYRKLITDPENLVKNKRYYTERYWILRTKNEIIGNFKNGITQLKLKGIYEGIFTYAVVIIGMLGRCQDIKGDISTSNEQSKIADYIAWTQTVKCNPKRPKRPGDRQVPTQTMWNNCPNHILREELNTLNPRYLLVLGPDNYRHVRKLMFDMDYIQDYEYRPRTKESPQINYWKGKKGDNFIHVICVPHPSFGWGHPKVAKELRRVVQTHIKDEVL